MNAKASREYLKVWRLQDAGNLELMHGTTATFSMPRHFHEELELSVVQGSAWEFFYRGNKTVVAPATFTLTQPGEVHTARIIGEVGCAFGGLRVPTELLQNTILDISGKQGLPYFSTPTIIDKSINRRLHNLFKTLKARQPSVLEQQSFVLDMLVQLILQFAENRPTLKPIGDEHQPIQQVRDYLEDNYVENVSLEQLAQIANLSPFYLNRAFCKVFGLPPHA